MTAIDHATLRRITEERLASFRDTLKSRITPKDNAFGGDGKRLVTQNLPKLDKHLTFALRHFEIGLLEPHEPTVPLSMTNNMEVHGDWYGGMLQQGTDRSTQSATNTFNREGANEALGKLVEALKVVSLPRIPRSMPSDTGRHDDTQFLACPLR